MSELEKLVRRRMQEEYSKGSSAEQVSQAVREIFNNVDISGRGSDAPTGKNRSR